MKPHTAAAIACFQAFYGQRFRLSPVDEQIWAKVLDDRDPKEVERAALDVGRRHTHGAAGLAELLQALDGVFRLRWATQTDCFGCANPALGRVAVIEWCDYATGRPRRSYNQAGDLIDPTTLGIITTADKLAPGMRLDAGVVGPLIEAELEGRSDG